MPPAPVSDTPSSRPGFPTIVLLMASVLLVTGIVIAPKINHIMDVFWFFLPWAKASGGTAPWRIYVARSECNYPPLWLYVLTLTERVRLLLHTGAESGMAIILLKLPSLVALFGGVLGGSDFYVNRSERMPLGRGQLRSRFVWRCGWTRRYGGRSMCRSVSC